MVSKKRGGFAENFRKKGIALWKEAKRIIPGGGQLLSKRPELFLPEQWPPYFQKARGVEVWDVDGNHYVDMSLMGVGSCILGYAHPAVNRAVKRVVEAGSMCTLNSPEEVRLARLLCELHPWAAMARFARTGGEAMAVAVRIARAYAGKEKVAFCGYHGWADWYLAANLADDQNLDGHLLPGLKPAGVPRGLRGTALPFHYNNIGELEAIVRENRDIGVIVVEPLRHQEPAAGFLEEVRAIATRIGAVLIFDEITIGWRMVVGGVHLRYKVYPDIAVFAKGMSNGYPMAAIVGTREVMDAAQDTFISSTFWTERIGPAAALATIAELREKDIPAHIERIGTLIGEGWKSLAEKHRLKIDVVGPPALVTFSFAYGKESQAVRTLFSQEMLARGFLAGPSVYVSAAHTQRHVERYLDGVDAAFRIIARALRTKRIRRLLRGPVAQSGFARLT